MSSQERILKALREAREQVKAAERRHREPIAVVGMGCRLPGGVSTPDQYWQLLCDGVDAMKEVPADRWDIAEYYDPDPDAPGKVYAREGGFIDGIDLFDPHFFRISPREALTLDPQQRLLLEVAWEALEDAGESADAVRGSNTGFFVGMSWHDYERNTYGMDPERLDAYSAMGNTQSIAVGRLAFVLGAHGPTSMVDTACSASLVAVHAACQSLRAGEADMVLAGGVNLMISPLSTIFCCKVKALSPDSRCKTFDAAADGYGRGEGCGLVVLKRLSDALADGNHIRAVIRGTAINHDGPSSGLTVPNRGAQADVIRRALDNGDIDPLDVGYVEAHGTGTSLGDPIEVGALGDALGKGRSSDRPLRLGSVKTNFGHLEAAAGIAGLMKAVLAIEHGRIPPHLHFRHPSPNIAWDDFPVEVPTRTVPWLAGPRLAGVSAFGFSGTNAHMVLGEAPAVEQKALASGRTREILCLSARDEPALRSMAQQYAAALAGNGPTELADVCHSANAGRARFAERLAVVTADSVQMAEQLGRFAREGKAPAVVSGKSGAHRRDKIAFMFTGQGSQWSGMGRGLYESQPVFREAMNTCQQLLTDELELPLLDVMFGIGRAADKADLLDQTGYTQPALFVLEWSLAQLWRSWGVHPALVMGHSVGEYAAACVAGVFSLTDGLRLIAARGRLMQALPSGGVMVAVSADEPKVARALQGHEAAVSIAAVNGPREIVVSGAGEAVAKVLAGLRDEGIETRNLTVSHAFHSPLMEPMLDEFEKQLSSVALSSPKIGLISNVSGALVGDEMARPSYWRNHVRAAVRFADGARALARAGASVYLELGPHPVLTGMGQRCVDEPQALWVAGMKRDGMDEEEVLRCKGQLFVRGIEQDWRAFDAEIPRRRVRVPTYPFQRKRYWVDAQGYGSLQSRAGGGQNRPEHPLLGRRVAAAVLQRGTTLLESRISVQSPPWLADHGVFGQHVPPATMFMEMALAAGRDCLEVSRPGLSNVAIHQPLFLGDENPATLQSVLEPAEGGRYRFRILSLEPATSAGNADWILHATGEIHSLSTSGETSSRPQDVLASEGVSIARIYQDFSEQGLELGSAFRTLRRIWKSGEDAWAQVSIDGSLEQEGRRYCIHPALLDACGQLIASAFPPAPGALFLPIGVEQLTVLRHGVTSGWLRGRLRPDGAAGTSLRVADIELFDDVGALALRVEGATTRLARREDVRRGMDRDTNQFYFARHWEAATVAAEQMVPETRQWLVFATANATMANSAAADLVASLRKAGDSVILVNPGKTFVAGDDGQCEIDPSLSQHYQALIDMCRNRQDASRLGLVYFGTSDQAPVADPGVTEALGCGGVPLLLRALGTAGYANSARLWLVSRATQRTGVSGEQLSTAGAALWGLGAVVTLEHPELRCVRIDLDAQGGQGEAELLQRELLENGVEDQVAFRKGQRLVARLQKLVAQDADEQLRIRDDALYLITGGFGALGIELARQIAARGGRYLALVGRSGAGAAAASVAALEREGVSVRSIRCDISDRASVDRLMSEIAASGLPLAGIFHTAGVLDDGILLQMDVSRMAQVMRAKVSGAWNLHLASQSLNQPLDYFVSFSSTASLLGSRGQSNYAAANAWLDSFAHFRRQQSLPALTINWGPWAEIGMAAKMDVIGTRRMVEMGWSPLAPGSGMVSLFDLLTSAHAQVGVIPLKWQSFLRQYEGAILPAFYAGLDTGVIVEAARAGDANDGAIRQHISQATGEQRRQIVREYLRRRVAAIVGRGDTDLPDSAVTFQELGVDSLLHMELRSAVVRDLATPIPIAEFLENPTVESLCDLVLKQMALSSMTAGGADESGDMEELTL